MSVGLVRAWASVLTVAVCFSHSGIAADLFQQNMFKDGGIPLSSNFSDFGRVYSTRVTAPQGTLNGKVTFQVNLPIPTSDLSLNFNQSLDWLAVEDAATGALTPLQLDPLTYGPKIGGSSEIQIVRATGQTALPSGVNPGDIFKVDLHYIRFATLEDRSTTNQLLPIPSSYFEFFGQQSWIFAVDAQDHYYVMDLSQPTNVKILNLGPERADYVYYNVLQPVNPNAPGAYSHLFGCHVHVTVFKDGNIRMNLMFNNGSADVDDSTDLDNPISTFFFKGLYLVLDKDFNIRTTISDSYSDYINGYSGFIPASPNHGISAISLPEHRLYPIADMRFESGGDPSSPFPFPSYAARYGLGFHRYFSLTKKSDDPLGLLAQERARFVDRAFVEKGSSVISWWTDPALMSGRYYPHRITLPTLEFADNLGNEENSRQVIDQHFCNELSARESAYSADANYLNEYQHSPHGPFKSEHQRYGGPTGGVPGIPADGMRILWAGSQCGLNYLALRFMGMHHRQFFQLYSHTGEALADDHFLKPISQYPGFHRDGKHFIYAKPEARYESNLTYPYYPFLYNDPSDYTGIDKYGLYLADQTQAQWVKDNGYDWVHQSNNVNYDPMDFQHGIIYQQWAMDLYWTTGFYPALEAIKMAAANGKHTLSLYPDNSALPDGSNALWTIKRKVYGQSADPNNPSSDAEPNVGAPFGRGEAWALMANSAYHSIEKNVGVREGIKDYLIEAIQTMSDAQMCNERIYTTYNPGKLEQDLFETTQDFEEVLNDLVRKSIYDGVLRGTGEPTEATLINLLRSRIDSVNSDMNWIAGQGPHKYVPTRALASTQPFCTDPDPSDTIINISFDPGQPTLLPKDFDCVFNHQAGQYCTGASGTMDPFYTGNALGMTDLVFDRTIAAEKQNIDDALCSLQEIHGSFDEFVSNLTTFGPNGSTDNLGNNSMSLLLLQQELERNPGVTDFCGP